MKGSMASGMRAANPTKFCTAILEATTLTAPTNDRAPVECFVLWLTFEDERLDDESRSVKERNKIYEQDDTSWHFYIQDRIIPAYERKFSEKLGYPVRIFLHDNP